MSTLPNPAADASIVPEVPTDRDASGRFRKGHKITPLASKEFQRLRELRELFWSIVTDEDARRVWEGIQQIAFHGKDERNRLSALLHLDERMLGKVTQPVAIDVNTARNRPLDVQLSQVEQEILERVISRQRSDNEQEIVVEALPSSKGKMNLATIDHEGLNAWLEQPGNHYLGFGGAGDALLLLATCYDDPDAKVTFFSNELHFAPLFFGVFGIPVFIHRNIKPCQPLLDVYKRITSMPNFCLSAHLPDNLDHNDWRKRAGEYRSRLFTYTKWKEIFGEEHFLGQPLVVICPCGSERKPGHRRYLTRQEYQQVVAAYHRRGFIVVVVGTAEEREEYGFGEQPFYWWTASDVRSVKLMLAIVNGATEIFSVDSWLKTYSACAGVKTKVILPFEEQNGTKPFGSSCSDYVFLDPLIYPDIQLLRRLPG